MQLLFFFFQAEDGIRDLTVTGVQTCALPIWSRRSFAFASDPTAPMNVVEAPRLDIWSAKFVAFPPGNGSKRGTSACTSPGAKSSIGGVTKSTIPSPIATTRGGREAIPHARQSP